MDDREVNISTDSFDIQAIKTPTSKDEHPKEEKKKKSSSKKKLTKSKRRVNFFFRIFNNVFRILNYKTFITKTNYSVSS